MCPGISVVQSDYIDSLRIVRPRRHTALYAASCWVVARGLRNKSFWQDVSRHWALSTGSLFKTRALKSLKLTTGRLPKEVSIGRPAAQWPIRAFLKSGDTQYVAWPMLSLQQPDPATSFIYLLGLLGLRSGGALVRPICEFEWEHQLYTYSLLTSFSKHQLLLLSLTHCAIATKNFHLPRRAVSERRRRDPVDNLISTPRQLLSLHSYQLYQSAVIGKLLNF
ncbi:hypothetical protein F4777DRAFT_334975 [Nemania sp. FL0916]|nr:hypothetical protein F4777DRAFT_334975 [Nemania sp. FL0916]